MIDVSAEQLNIILNILKQNMPGYEVRAFGSRHKWTAKDYSDLDLAVVGETKLDWKIISNLKEAFEESNLPFRVEVLDWHAISPEFRALIEAGYEVIQKRQPAHGRTQTEGLDMEDKGCKTVKLKDCCTKIGSGATPRGGKEVYLDEGSFSLIRSQNVLDFFFSYNGLAFIDKDQAYQLSNVEIEEKDVLLNITGDSVARVCQVPGTLLPARVNQHVSIIRPDKSKLVPEFLKYFLLNPKFKNYMLGLASVGGTRNALTKGMIEDFEINLPSLSTQTRIAAILTALDDKIELNRQTNQTLEAIAQAIFKEWFVDFRFPHSPLEGWQAKPDGVDSSLCPCPTGRVDSLPAKPDGVDSPLEGWQAKPDGVDSSLRPCPTGGVDSLPAKPTPLPSWQKNSLFPFWTLPKNHKLQERAKGLRKQGILSEVVFWKAFKDKKKLGWDIDRQVIIGNFIVDFFIPELGLVFEIDGSSHNDKQEYDQQRDAFLSSLQLKVVRISDKDVLRNIEGVWSFVTESIKDRVEGLAEKSPPRPLGLKEKHPPRPSGTPQEGNNPPRQASPATPQEGNKYKDDGGEMQDSELCPIPKGWKVGKLSDFGNIICGKTPSKANDNFFGGQIPFIKIPDMHNSVFITNTEDSLSEEGAQSQRNKFIPPSSVIVSCIATVGLVAITSEKSQTNQQINAIIPKEEYFAYYLYYCALDLKEVLKDLGSGGSATLNVNTTSFSNIKCIMPSEEVMRSFDSLTKPIFEEILSIDHQSATLAAIRDALLPKLMNGEIEV